MVMNETAAYLKTYYQSADEFAASCSITTDVLAGLLGEQLIPAPSYTVTDPNMLISQAFGELAVEGATPGQYFHPANATWVKLALDARENYRAQEAHLLLKNRFTANFGAALAEMDKDIFRLRDAFTDTGEIVADGLKARLDGAWEAFVNGVFSLCVADPSTEKSIARKEILQEALTEFSENTSVADVSAETRQHVLELIDSYAEAAMPFAPPEYPGSSRKRLVEDLRKAIVESCKQEVN